MSNDLGPLLVHVREPLAGAGPSPADAASGPVPADREPVPWPYLLVHGSMDRSTSFVRLAARLPDATVITYDRRGYAGSSSRAPSEDFADQVADLLEVVAGREVVAFGHSFGGDVVLAAAARHPELIRAALVWEAPMPWLPWWPTATAGGAVVDDDRDHADVAEAFMRRMVSDRIWERLPATTREARRSEGPALIAEMRSLRTTTPWDPAGVTIPVIVGVGGASRDHHRRLAVELAAALPDAELVSLPDARHGAHLSHPADLAVLLERVARRAMSSPGAAAPTPAAGPWAPAGSGEAMGVGHRPGASSTVAGCPRPAANEEQP